MSATGPGTRDEPRRPDDRPRLTLVAARGRNGVIGRDGGLPWHLPEDLRRFRELTWGTAMIMGRATWQAIGRPLPGRTSVVVTRTPGWSAPGAVVVHDLQEALALYPGEPLSVIGGGQVYAQTIDLADRLEITEVDQEPEGDTLFPQIDPQRWRETARQGRGGYAFVTYERRRPGGPAQAS